MDTRRKMRWALSLFSCILLGLLAFSVPAQGDDDVSSVSANPSVDSLTIQKDIPKPLRDRLTSPSEDAVSPIPATDRTIINKLRAADTTGQIVSEEVLPDQRKLVIYAFGNSEKFSEIIADEQPQLTFEFVSSPHSKVELLEQISHLLNKTDQFNGALVEIGPRKDGTTIDITLDEQLCDRTAALDTYSPLSSIPLEFSFGERAVATF
ncbi:hypothetical protein [Bifidobacterium psychraerophilum]|jgi:hypothetical protein|uniref:hypothetical protein n=1 Tax=Bifidobacterium psychraerophilum TaxID=218140 RepID=UPI0023F42177|nr:hypothetical protein [Bifidobacterium psychraerophilum]MCI1659665.1 hypothetical protein [Bifidobacterium psychraerophilum]MCI1805436.1 hypothetical protein [Bifidobacterium psychraerophilum]MCI2176091.1 hypothetical protein [Bifidobacterium psychraerophilum]MCI2182661.1 hypothetical protein [Bifidobacterium psychraerophilum]